MKVEIDWSGDTPVVQVGENGSLGQGGGRENGWMDLRHSKKVSFSRLGDRLSMAGRGSKLSRMPTQCFGLEQLQSVIHLEREYLQRNRLVLGDGGWTLMASMWDTLNWNIKPP